LQQGWGIYLTNVKARGTWGEVQLGSLLEQILTPDQYDKNVNIKAGSQESVEYAIRLPGKDNSLESCVWMPIDSKFPQEDYLRLVEAADAADIDAVHRATAGLIRSVHNSAKEIRDKYIEPPKTTDFAIMFLPTEGLYAEVLRQPGQVEKIQQDYRIVIAGPTSLSAILSSLRIGFRTLAIEKRSSEVWKILAAVCFKQGQEAVEYRFEHHRSNRYKNPCHGAQATGGGGTAAGINSKNSGIACRRCI